MSLINALYVSFAGIRTTDAQTATVSQNVTNADVEGYTTKTYQTTLETAAGVTVPVSGTVVGSIDKYLYATTIQDASDSSYTKTLSDYLTNYNNAFGSTDSSSTSLSSAIDNLESSLESLQTSPDDNSAKNTVVSNAQSVALQLNTLSDTIQKARQQTDSEIGTTVDTINQSLKSIDSLNRQIASLQAQGQSTADLEDQRMTALSTLAGDIGVNYYINSDNQMNVSTSSGLPLVDSQAHTLSYTTTASLTAAATYPSGVSAITLDGKDITTSTTNGSLGALIQLRDSTFPQEQDKLNTLASTMSDAVNSVLNQGASYPSRTTMTGDTNALTSPTAFSGTGTVRVAVTDQSGVVQNYQDLDLSSYSTVGNLVTALNSISGVSASLNANGQMVLSSTSSGDGISINEMDSSIGGSGSGFSSYFGLNDLFTGDSAGTIKVSSYLAASSDYLATGVLSSDSGLAAGDQGVTKGDGTIAGDLVSVFTNGSSFAASGNFSAQTSTFASYAADIIASASTQASTASSNNDSAQSLYTQTKSLLDNEDGVNVDDQTAKLTVLQNQYSSSALVINAIRTMFSELITAIENG